MAEKRNTKQKQVIYSVIKELKCHPTAQQLHQILVERGYNIGASTVYRVLADAVDDGIIMNVFSFDKNEHFDGNPVPHYHIICTKCGRIFDSHVPYDPEIDERGRLADEDFLITSHALFVPLPECALVFLALPPLLLAAIFFTPLPVLFECALQ